MLIKPLYLFAEQEESSIPAQESRTTKEKKGKKNKNQTQQPPKFAIRSKQTELSKTKFQKIKNHQLDNRGKKKKKKKPSQRGERKRGHNTNHKPGDLGYMTAKNARFFSSLSRIMRKKCNNPGLISSDRLHRGLSSNVCVNTRILLQTARCPDALPSSSSPTRSQDPIPIAISTP